MLSYAYLRNILNKNQRFYIQYFVNFSLEKKGSHLYSIYPHGSTDKLPYTTMGSGSLAAMAVFESRWKPDLEEAEGIQLVCFPYYT